MDKSSYIQWLLWGGRELMKTLLVLRAIQENVIFEKGPLVVVYE